NPTNADALIQRADLYRLHQNWPEARNDYATARTLAPDSIPLLLGIAQLHAETGEDTAARVAFDTLLNRDPTNSTALFGRARVLVRLKDMKAAIADYSHGLAATTAPQPEQFLDRANLQATEFGVEEAIKGLDEGIARLGWGVALQKAAIDLELKRS